MTEEQPRPPRLLDRLRDAIRARHYSRRTEEAYVTWVRRYIVYQGKRHPEALNGRHVGEFLTWLATAQHVSASTQNQALSANLFLYRTVLGCDLGVLPSIPRARTPERVPVVLSRGEALRVIAELRGVPRLVVMVLYGAGLRLLECLQLRVKDLDFDRHQIVIRQGKGQKDRVTMLPVAVRSDLQSHLGGVKVQHEADLRAGLGRVVLPFAVGGKYPHAGVEWGWQFVFPAARICRDQAVGRRSERHSR